jgi:signal transduction histidine kinase
VNLIDYKNVELNDGFLHQKQVLNENVTIDAVYNRFYDTGRISAFECNWKEGEENEPHCFWDSDVAKWIEAAAYISNKKEDKLLESRIDELIDFVKLDTSEWRQSLQSKKIKSILEEFCKRVSMDAQLLNKNFSYDIQLSDTISVSLDEKLFLRALENLTSNAFRYTAKDGNIFLSAKLDEKQKSVFISIKDNGQGISQKDLPFIFDPLYRGTNSRREDGKGLGLSIVKTVVNSHGWNLKVLSQEGKGCEFILQLGV